MKTLITVSGMLCGSLFSEVVTVPDPHVSMPEGKTVVWSPLLQAAWDEMNRSLGGPPHKISPPNEIMKRMDSFRWQADEVLPDGAWKTWAVAATPVFFERVNREAREALGGKEGPFKMLNMDPRFLACFALLDRSVEFEVPFYRSKKVPLRFDNRHVRFFGTAGHHSARFGESVKVLHDEPRNRSYALEASCKGMDDRVVFLLPSDELDFAQACQFVREVRKSHATNSPKPIWQDSGYLRSGDRVKIPCVSLDVIHDMSGDFTQRRWHGTPLDPWQIVRAEQKTRFSLHEKGAKVRVHASIEVKPFGSPPKPPPPRHFIFDRPFFVFLWRENAKWPYLGVWVGDVSVLEPME